MHDAKLTVLDLFSGIGGFSLGLERAGFETVGFCEAIPFRRQVLKKHWPNVWQHEQVETLTKSVIHAYTECSEIEVVCGGPPCQRTSTAAAIQGKRTGETLWPEMCRVVKAVRPRWVVVEQPSGNAGWERQVADDLARVGYFTTRLRAQASDCGAPHRRRRVFIVANAVRERCEAVARLAGPSTSTATPWPAPPRGTWRQAGSGRGGMDDGFSDWVDRLAALGDSVVPQCVELIGRAIMEVERCTTTTT